MLKDLHILCNRNENEKDPDDVKKETLIILKKGIEYSWFLKKYTKPNKR